MKEVKDLKERIMEVTGRSEQEAIIIDYILNDHFIIGRHNKEKIIADFKDKLKLNDEEADELYNQCSEIIVKAIFRRK